MQVVYGLYQDSKLEVASLTIHIAAANTASLLLSICVLKRNPENGLK
jgi:hypothetical protein